MEIIIYVFLGKFSKGDWAEWILFLYFFGDSSGIIHLKESNFPSKMW